MHATEYPTLEGLVAAVRQCRACEKELPLGPRPVLRAAASARILVVGQAPGARAHASGIAWVDASSCDEAALGPGLDRSLVLSRFHVRNADGSLTSGAAAFVAVWRRLPAFAWLATLASSRPMLAVLDVGYWIFLRVRRWWRPARTEVPRENVVPGGAEHS